MKYRTALAFALAALLLLPAAALAADIETSAKNFSTSMTIVGSASAIGIGILAGIAMALGNSLGWAKAASGGKIGLFCAAALMVITGILNVISGTIAKWTA